MLPMNTGFPDGLLFLELHNNGRDVKITKQIRCASARNNPGTFTILCLKLMLIQCGETDACSLDCVNVLGFFVSLAQESSTLSLTATATWVKRDNSGLC